MAIRDLLTCPRSECCLLIIPEWVGFRNIAGNLSFWHKIFPVYDPDPIASLRKRRVSTDSHDSGASHGEHRTHEIVKKSSKLVDNSFPSEKKKSKSGDVKIKKKHKKCHKHGHHHCHKHKHKRHKSGESSSKKSFEQKFAIRSPPHGSHYVKSDHDNESSEASQEESDQQNSSDEEVGFSRLCESKKVR